MDMGMRQISLTMLENLTAFINFGFIYWPAEKRNHTYHVGPLG